MMIYGAAKKKVWHYRPSTHKARGKSLVTKPILARDVTSSLKLFAKGQSMSCTNDVLLTVCILPTNQLHISQEPVWSPDSTCIAI